ncbi:hypothetical protein CJJ23_00250 [Mycoplasmopsis agassizii]|uniref:Uncharacterized protein n=1 Tax=Mycoplasmopsis agassizii TaxID=33922 RepID=A0A269TJX0_9BACT|nr:hypothetical protein [Mycoplasmopsis agassizii]PAK21762.1 hypothetical protein CJJ23_00250 [Mycoplasmopsis agassizii]
MLELEHAFQSFQVFFVLVSWTIDEQLIATVIDATVVKDTVETSNLFLLNDIFYYHLNILKIHIHAFLKLESEWKKFFSNPDFIWQIKVVKY